MSAILVAVPSDAPGGLDAAPSGHFGHCDLYTVASIEDGVVGETRLVPNAGHEHGNCIAPVQELAAQGVQVLIAGGMGMRPLMAMREAGMAVYHNGGLLSVGRVLDAFAAGKLHAFEEDNLCKGGCGGHHSH